MEYRKRLYKLVQIDRTQLVLVTIEQLANFCQADQSFGNTLTLKDISDFMNDETKQDTYESTSTQRSAEKVCAHYWVN